MACDETKSRRVAAGAVLFLFTMLAADAVALLAASPVTITGSVQRFLRETERPAAGAVLGILLGVGMVWAGGYGPISPRTAYERREARRRYAEGKTVRNIWEDSVTAGEAPQARCQRIREKLEDGLLQAEAEAAGMAPQASCEAAGLPDRLQATNRRQALWMVCHAVLWACWMILAADVLFFAFTGRIGSVWAFGTFAPGCLLSFCLSASLSHLTGWGPRFADLESGSV